MRQPPQLPEPFASGPFSVGDAVARGVSRSTLRSPLLEHPFWGIRSVEALEGDAAILAFAPRLPSRAFYYGISAALLHGMPLPGRLARQHPVHVGVRAGDRRVAAHGVKAHHVTIADRDVIAREGIRITSLERTWCDLSAAGLSLAELVAAGDSVLWRRNPRTSAAELKRAAGRYEGRRGSALIRAALPLLTDRADSAPESEIRVAILSAGLPSPAVNEPVLVDGILIASPDLSWPRYRVALEYEGDHHRTDAQQWHYDIERYARLQELGWIVIRATAKDYRDPSALVARVTRALASRR